MWHCCWPGSDSFEDTSAYIQQQFENLNKRKDTKECSAKIHGNPLAVLWGVRCIGLSGDFAQGHQGDLQSLHVRHWHQQRPVRLRRRHGRHHQEQPQRLWTFLTTHWHAQTYSFVQWPVTSLRNTRDVDSITQAGLLNRVMRNVPTKTGL